MSVIESTETKPTNPKDAIASVLKVPLISVVPWRVVTPLGLSSCVRRWLALAMHEGALKYAVYNYRTAGVRASVYVDAACRHLDAIEIGEDMDPDSGLPHWIKALASLVVLADGILEGNATIDAPASAQKRLVMASIDGEFDVDTDALRHALQSWWDGPQICDLNQVLRGFADACERYRPFITVAEANAHAARLCKAHAIKRSVD